MKLVGLTLFGVGYVLGSKAGRERYEQLRALARSAADRFDDPNTQSRLRAYTERLETFARPEEIDTHFGGQATNGAGSRAKTRNG